MGSEEQKVFIRYQKNLPGIFHPGGLRIRRQPVRDGCARSTGDKRKKGRKRKQTTYSGQTFSRFSAKEDHVRICKGKRFIFQSFCNGL